MAEYPAGEFLLPLFPLPDLVFFPKTRLPLHIFEPRYRALVTDALRSDERFGIVLPKESLLGSDPAAPALHDYGTLARIEQSVQLDNGRYNILVSGVVRFRIVELVAEKPYRVARVVADPELVAEPMECWAQREWLVDLSRRYLEFLPGNMEVPELDSATLDSLTNALVMSLNLEVHERQELLEMPELTRRAEKVGEVLAGRLHSLQFLAPYRRGSDPSLN